MNPCTAAHASACDTIARVTESWRNGSSETLAGQDTADRLVNVDANGEQHPDGDIHPDPNTDRHAACAGWHDGRVVHRQWALRPDVYRWRGHDLRLRIPPELPSLHDGYSMRRSPHRHRDLKMQAGTSSSPCRLLRQQDTRSMRRTVAPIQHSSDQMWWSRQRRPHHCFHRERSPGSLRCSSWWGGRPSVPACIRNRLAARCWRPSHVRLLSVNCGRHEPRGTNSRSREAFILKSVLLRSATKCNQTATSTTYARCARNTKAPDLAGITGLS